MEQYSRCKILEEDFERSNEESLKDFIGSDAKIVKIEKQNIIIDNYVIVDVWYIILGINPLDIYYINKSDLKLSKPDTNKYIVKVNDIPVQLSLKTEIVNKLDIIPIRIYKTIPSNYLSTVQYEYYGLYESQPLHSYCTELSFPEYNFIVNDEIPSVLKSNTKIIWNDEEINNSYNTLLMNTIYAKYINQRIHIDNINNIETDTNKAYIIDINLIKADFSGLIYVSKFRKPYDVLLIPLKLYFITNEKLQKLKSFLYHDEQIYTKYVETLKL